MARSRKGRVRQHMLRFPNGWGGRRRGAGRKPTGERAGVPHRRREEFHAPAPLLVTLRVRPGLPALREPGAVRAVESCFAAVHRRELEEERGFRIVHYSIQTNHLHLVVEAHNGEVFRSGMQGLTVRIARALNRWWSRKGTLFSDRFHSRRIGTAREMRNVLRYVLTNARKHGSQLSRSDPCSSGAAFDGWEGPEASRPRTRHAGLRRVPDPPKLPLCVLRATTWVARNGWKRHGRIGLQEAPA